MEHPLVHFEIAGADPDALRGFYGRLFDWRFDVGTATSAAVSAPEQYGFVDSGGDGPNGGVAGGEGFGPRVLFYIGVADVEAALAQAEALGGTRVMGPEGEPGSLVVGHSRDPEGNLVGVADTR